MEAANKKLTAIIDQLLVLCRENPWLIIPANEEKRLEVVIQKLLKKETFTAEEWEKIKPYIPENPAVAEQRKLKLKKEWVKSTIEKTIELNKDIIKETESYRKQNADFKLQNRISISNNLPARAEFRFCKKCNTRFTVGEFEKHIKVCGKKKRK